MNRLIPPSVSDHAQRKAAWAFTLIELLAAMSVFGILMVAVIGILSGATILTGQSRKYMDTDSEARMIFDRMAEDFGGMIRRDDLDYLFAKSTGNDSLFFYSEAPALADNTTGASQTTCALIGYRINTSFQLERLGKGLAWGGAPPEGMTFLTYASYTPPPLSPDLNSTFANSNWTPLIGTESAYNNSTNTSYYHVLGDEVFRLEYCFLLKPLKQQDGSMLPAIYSNLAYRTMAQGASPDPTKLYGPGTTSTTLYGLGVTNLEAVVVTLALLDDKTRQLVSTSNLQALANALPDPQDSDLAESPPQLTAQTWDVKLAATSIPGVPKPAVANIHVYQRTFYLGPFLNQ